MINLSVACRTARAAAVIATVDAGSGPGAIRFYNGTRPVAGGTATTLICTMTLKDPCGAAAAGVFTLDPPNAAQVTTSGVITWARVSDSAGAWVIDCDCGTSGTEIVLDVTTVFAGAYVTLVSGTLTEGG